MRSSINWTSEEGQRILADCRYWVADERSAGCGLATSRARLLARLVEYDLGGPCLHAEANYGYPSDDYGVICPTCKTVVVQPRAHEAEAEGPGAGRKP